MRHVIVKNWEKFQHQSDRRLPWIKLFTALLEPTRDPAYALLSDTSKALLHHIWLMARVFNNRIPEDWLCKERLNLQTKVNLDELLRSGFISYEDQSSLLACARRASETLVVSSFLSEEGESEGKPLAAFFDEVWKDYPRKRGREKAFEHFAAQVQSRADLAALKSAVRNYRREVEILGTQERYVLHGGTFFNRRWREFVDGVWTPPAPPAVPPVSAQPRFVPIRDDEDES